ncbi:MAG TPA: transcriptional repressor LexA [Steroidobacter sp.]|nr:transcriptional repressor LexA [Steroidobacter sp.]
MPDLTSRQLEVLAFIRRFVDTRAMPPTRGEIAQGLGLKNRQGVEQHLRALASKGAIELIPGVSRGVRLRDVERSAGAAHAHGLPLLGRVAAGAPILTAENIEDYVNVDAALFRPRGDFLLRVHGDSMKDADIRDRDLLVVHQSAQAHNGQIVVARIDEEATVKYYRKEGSLVRLEPANPAYEPIVVDLREQFFAIEGLVVGVIRCRM